MVARTVWSAGWIAASFERPSLLEGPTHRPPRVRVLDRTRCTSSGRRTTKSAGSRPKSSRPHVRLGRLPSRPRPRSRCGHAASARRRPTESDQEHSLAWARANHHSPPISKESCSNLARARARIGRPSYRVEDDRADERAGADVARPTPRMILAGSQQDSPAEVEDGLVAALVAVVRRDEAERRVEVLGVCQATRREAQARASSRLRTGLRGRSGQYSASKTRPLGGCARSGSDGVTTILAEGGDAPGRRRRDASAGSLPLAQTRHFAAFARANSANVVPLLPVSSKRSSVSPAA